MTAAIMVHDYENENPEQERHPRECGDLTIISRSLKVGYPVGAGYDGSDYGFTIMKMKTPNRNVILAKAGISWLWKHSLIRGYTAGAGYDDDRGAGIS